MLKNIHFAILSGFCASTASTFGKLSGLPTLEGYFPLRVILFLCMVICNGAVWTLFVKALQQTNSSLSATVASSASNYIFFVIEPILYFFQAITGFVLFEETTSLFWWSGMFFIIIGLLLVLSNEKNVENIAEKHN
ncbi:hypothetical protein NQ314_016504 [Rhamnusium bicolor]|uniref:EamA domain-containing protein n=1 Tax=Rhamnusium bicolor TaxID=1586634 RepID=A0AAV8WW90_9CUCU|nr:hypothetical protein NQ314_016504 [Rhamnusium bicolor]